MLKLRLYWIRTLLAACTVGFNAGAALAVEIDITAIFEQKPGTTTYKFENTTPKSGICALVAVVCPPGGFSVATNITTGKKKLATNTSSTNDREHAFFKLIDAKTTTVKMAGSAKEFPITFTPTLFASDYRTDTFLSTGNWVGGDFSCSWRPL